MGPAVIEKPRSALTHKDASKVFDIAAKEPVRITSRGDDPDEVLLSAESYDAWRRLLRSLYLLTRALAKGAERMPDLEGMHWTKLFDLEERQQMLGELVEAARASLERNDASLFNATWKGWEHSAEALDDPDLLKKLTTPTEPTAMIPLPRP